MKSFNFKRRGVMPEEKKSIKVPVLANLKTPFRDKDGHTITAHDKDVYSIVALPDPVTVGEFTADYKIKMLNKHEHGRFSFLLIDTLSSLNSWGLLPQKS
jgi:hypothetical protein